VAEWVALTFRQTAELPRIVEPLLTAMARQSYPEQDVFAVRLALEEALVNAVKHGHGGDATKTVRVRFRVSAEDVQAEVEDEGPGFDPECVPDPTAAENVERCGGRGLLLMRHFLTELSFHGRGNHLRLRKRRSDR
jgi:serine/threonine-protein kinase RsbW